MGEEKKGFFSRLKEGLSKTRNNIVYGIDSVFNGFSNIDEDFYEELEEILIMGDVGIKATDAGAGIPYQGAGGLQGISDTKYTGADGCAGYGV